MFKVASTLLSTAMAKKNVVIIGAVAGGATAAARLRRLDENVNIVMLERGEYVSFANCGLPYYVGEVIPKRESLLVQTVQGLKARFNIDIRVKHEVVAIDKAAKTLAVKNLATGELLQQPYDRLILAPGAKPIRPPLAGLDAALAGGHVFTLRSIPDTDAIKAKADALLAAAATEATKAGAPPRKPEVVVIGGGFIGLEMAEVLALRGCDVTVVELGAQVMPPLDFELAQMVHAHLIDNGVKLRLGVSVTGITAPPPSPAPAAVEDGKATGAAMSTLTLSDGSTLPSSLTILAVGVQPDSELAVKAGLVTGPRGAILVNKHMQTSEPSIYAVGDAVMTSDGVFPDEQVWIPLAGPANRQAHVVADHICGMPGAEYRGTIGTAIVKVFKLAVAQTGASEKSLKRAGKPHRVVHVHPSSHAGYYPGAQPMALKLLFHPSDGRVLGAQAVGADGVDKRIDVLATVIAGGMSVRHLTHLELCYAPPFGSAKDPVNIAGYAASNILDGIVDNVQWSDLAGYQLVTPGEAAVAAASDSSAMAVEEGSANGGAKPRAVLVDVREPGEVKAGGIEGAINIPLPQLRSRIAELEPAKQAGVPVLVSCQVGLRGYIGSRILASHGFKTVRNVDGGYKTYAAAVKQFPAAAGSSSKQ